MLSGLIAGTRPRTTPPSVPLHGTTARNTVVTIIHLATAKKHDRAESSKSQDRKHGPENTVTIAERSQFRSTFNQADLDRLLDGKCPWHKDATHTARECRAFSNGIIKDNDSKRPRRDDRDRPSGSRITRARRRWRN